jgi:RNA polymerase sigma-70 factor (ECF subfamily)
MNSLVMDRLGPADVERFEQAYRRHHDRLWRSLLAFTGDAELATEAAAETFSQALARGAAIRDVDAWLWRSAFRVAGGLLADRQASRGGPDELAPLAADGADGRGSHLDASLAEFLDQLAVLSEQQRTIVVLRYAGRFKPTEIADLLDTSAGTVRVQLHRAHQQLRDRIDNGE